MRSVDRIRRVLLSLEAFEEGRGTEEQRREPARELHTLKGDSAVVGQDALSQLAHAAEECVLASGGLPDPAACAEVRAVLALFERGLRGEATAAELAGGLGATASPLSAAAATQATQAAQGDRSASDWIRVKRARIDELTEGLAAFAADFALFAHRFRGGSGSERGLQEELAGCATRLESVIDAAWSLRLVPVEPALLELVRYTEGLAALSGKRARVTVQAHGAEVERTVLEELWEPLLHLVRNASDHGIEPPEQRGDKGPEGAISIEAAPVGASLCIAVVDDGRGVDPAAVRNTAVARELMSREAADALSEQEVHELLFLHGFSTRVSVSETSGRGVGLDVVRARVEALGGTVTLQSRPGLGSRFEVVVPATITKERCLVFACAGGLYALPAAQVLEVLRKSELPLSPGQAGQMVRHRGEAMPLRSMSTALGHAASADEPLVVLLRHGSKRVAFGIGDLLGERELLRRPTDPMLAPLGHVAASSTLEDGRLVLVLSTGGLVRRADGFEVGPTRTSAAGVTPRAARSLRVLVVDDSPTIRDLLVEILGEAGLQVQEATDGRSALAQLERGLPDLVLSDVEMPLVDGFELLRQIRARWDRLPVVMLTTRASADDRRRAISLGASAYVVKSEFEEGNLLSLVRQFARGAA